MLLSSFPCDYGNFLADLILLYLPAAFTRIITTLYTLTLLTLQTHVQLNLLGRSSYVTSVIASLPPSSTSASSTSAAESTSSDLEMGHSIDSIAIDADMERTYLTFSWWLLHRGWKLVADRVREAVEEVVGPCVFHPPPLRTLTSSHASCHADSSRIVKQRIFEGEHFIQRTISAACPDPIQDRSGCCRQCLHVS